MPELTVLTYNLLSPDHAAWPRRREIIRAGLRSLQPDVVALQECVRSGDYDQAVDLLGQDYDVVWHPGRSADGVGAVLASRAPFGEQRVVDLHLTERVTLPWAAAVLAEIELPPPLGRVLIAHHKPTYEIGYGLERELQALDTARAIERHVSGRDLHVILLGDFDDTPDSASMRFLTGRQSLQGTSVAYRDAWEAIHGADPGHTFARHNPLVRAGEMSLELGRRIDYILVRSGIHGPSLDILDCRRVFDQPTDHTWPSDHFAVLARIAVPDTRQVNGSPTTDMVRRTAGLARPSSRPDRMSRAESCVLSASDHEGANDDRTVTRRRRSPNRRRPGGQLDSRTTARR